MNIADDLSKAGVPQHIARIEIILTGHAIRDRSAAAALYQTGAPRRFILRELRDLSLRAALVGARRKTLLRSVQQLPDSPIRTALLAAINEQEDGRGVPSKSDVERMTAKHREYVEKLKEVA